MKACIAYIDDNYQNLQCIKTILNHEFNVETFLSAENFLKNFSKYSCEAILVDIHMPNLDGFALYEKIVEHPDYNGCPILFISSDESDSARIQSFSLGAVDFINRVISPDELLVRVKSKIQFFQKHRTIIEFTNLRVNLTLLKTYLNGKELPLTFMEMKILCLALKNYPDIVTKEQLVELAWGKDRVLDATIYTHVSNLNNKLESWDYEMNAMKHKGFQLQKKDQV